MSRPGERGTKVHCTIYFNPSVMIAFLNLHTEPHQLPLKTASSGHSVESVFDDSKSSFSSSHSFSSLSWWF